MPTQIKSNVTLWMNKKHTNGFKNNNKFVFIIREDQKADETLGKLLNIYKNKKRGQSISSFSVMADSSDFDNKTKRPNRCKIPMYICKKNIFIFIFQISMEPK